MLLLRAISGTAQFANPGPKPGPNHKLDSNHSHKLNLTLTKLRSATCKLRISKNARNITIKHTQERLKMMMMYKTVMYNIQTKI